MTSRIVYCRNCRCAYSTETRPADPCPKCNAQLVETNIPTDVWHSKSGEEKELLVNSILEIEKDPVSTASVEDLDVKEQKKDYPVDNEIKAIEKQIASVQSIIEESINMDKQQVENIEVLLKDIASSSATTAKWVKFWSILNLVIMGLGALGALYVVFESIL